MHVFQPRKYVRDLPRHLKKQIKKDDGLPQQICAKCFGKFEFMCGFLKQCQDIQKTISTPVTGHTEKIATCQKRSGAVIENEKTEAEANKENVVPTIKTSRSSRSSKNCLRQCNKSLLPLKKQMQTFVKPSYTEYNGQHISNDPPKAAAICTLRIQDLTIVKQEDVDSRETYSQDRSSITANIEQLIYVPSEKSQSDHSSTQKEIETSCASGDDKIESNKNESDSTLIQTTNINESTCIKTDKDVEIETAIVVASGQNNESTAGEKLPCKTQTNILNEALNHSKKKKNTCNKISELISEEQKHAIETGYRINMAVIDNKALMKKLTVLDKKNIKCNICAMNYSRMDKCKVHIMGHLEMKPYECKTCSFVTVTVSNIRTHIRKCHLKIKPYVCDQCEKHFMTMVLLQEHINTHTGARPFKCKNCNVAYASRQALNYHNMSHKPSKDVKCEICNKMFYSKARRRAHMLTHNKEDMLKCDICKSRLSSKANLEAHIKNVHSRKYICDICNKELTCKRAWYNHKNVHAKAKYQCTMCSNVYKSKHILEEHILKHKGIRKYKCNICEKSFAQQSHLAAHSATHSEIKFPCPGCEKLFNRHDNMKVHTRRCPFFLKKPELMNTFIPRIHTKSTNVPIKSN